MFDAVGAGQPVAATDLTVDTALLDDLYRAQFPHLKRLAYLMVGQESVAEDLVHDAFVASSRHLVRLADPETYLRTAVINGCRRHFRRRQRAARFADVHHSPGDSADAIAVRLALEGMPMRRRAAVVLRYFEDLTHDEIAATLGCRPSTARSLVHRGLDDLRKALTDD